jgi:hypothetical protein
MKRELSEPHDLPLRPRIDETSGPVSAPVRPHRPDYCPDCGDVLRPQGRCCYCPSCGYGVCG